MSRVSLDALPFELVWEIFILSRSSAFPLTCRYLYGALKTAPFSVHAEYIVNSYLDESERRHSLEVYHANIISRALRYPICNPSVLEAIFRSSIYPDRTSSPFVVPSTQLPRRLFRSLGASPKRAYTKDDEPLPFLEYLFSHPKVETLEVDSWDGYALVKAVAAGFVPLVRFLLDKGASPARKYALSVMVAIQKKDLGLVKMLIEPQACDTNTVSSSSSSSASKVGGKPRVEIRKSKRNMEAAHDSQRRAKKRKIEDRIQVNTEMLKAAVKCNARDIVNYFMVEKGVAPDMQTVLMMK